MADLFLKALKDLPREGGYDLPRPLIPARADTVRQVEERMDVVQGKLAMGLRTGGITACDGGYPALLLCNAVFGGTATSKLFLHVREELSLCYYADSGLHKFKGLMLVSSGVEFDQRRRAEDEIMAQLEACRRGEIQPWEMDGARRSVASALRTVLDSQGRQEDWWLGQAVAGLDQSPEALARDLEQVDVARVVQAAQALSLDTVYFLKGMEG